MEKPQADHPQADVPCPVMLDTGCDLGTLVILPGFRNKQKKGFSRNTHVELAVPALLVRVPGL